jgi:hypothetical protein
MHYPRTRCDSMLDWLVADMPVLRERSDLQLLIRGIRRKSAGSAVTAAGPWVS